ncbi:hypothetical protein BD410DRAFT_745952 [Rickenella mellea]|uniref:BTB domain-containing protein n=1 Tax=Rickenella mellea TaxID=50990 RepID=A0A4Y7QA22_9AGAM|nr:hypothetical protein BD410DRAFT_745952 [Rickenella mellea]
MLPIERDTTHYFANGDIVISSVNKAATSTILFRLHKVVLNHHSQVFSDMFSVPEPQAGGQELYEGCPLVHMSDSAEDLHYLFLYIYDPTAILPLNPIPTDSHFNQNHVAILLKLATKYEVDSLRNRMIAYLEAYWPSSLDEWDKLREWYHDPYEWCFRPEPVQAINLANAHDIPSIRPTVFYFLSTIRPDRDLDISEQRNDPDSTSPLAARWNSLGAQDLLRVMQGRQKINDFLEMVNPFLDGDDDIVELPCLMEGPETCSHHLLEFWDRVCLRSFRNLDPLDTLTHFRDLYDGNLLCDHCILRVERNVDRLRDLFWVRTGGYFEDDDDDELIY